MGPTHTTFYNHNTDLTVSDSTWARFPKESKPNRKYKYVSFKVFRDSSLRKIQRKNYGVLEWLADVGGISRALYAIG